MSFRFRLAALALAALVQPAAAEITIETARGPVTLDGPVIRIAAYDVATVDTLAALGAIPAGVPAPLYVSYLEEQTTGAATIGTVFEPDIEALAVLGPEIVIVGGRSAPKADLVARVAPALDMTIPAETLLASALDRLAALGTLTGREAEAEALADDLQGKLATARTAVAGKGTGLVILTNGPKVSAYGVGSRFGWIHDAVGLPEAREGLTPATHGEAVSFEFIAEVNPDWLLVVDRGAAIGAEGASAAQTLDNALVRETTAWSKGQVIYLDPAAVYLAGGGVQGLGIVLDQIATAFGTAS